MIMYKCENCELVFELGFGVTCDEPFFSYSQIVCLECGTMHKIVDYYNKHMPKGFSLEGSYGNRAFLHVANGPIYEYSDEYLKLYVEESDCEIEFMKINWNEIRELKLPDNLHPRYRAESVIPELSCEHCTLSNSLVLEENAVNNKWRMLDYNCPSCKKIKLKVHIITDI